MAPPGPEALASASLGALRSCSLTERKAEYLRDTARSIVEGRLDLERLRAESGHDPQKIDTEATAETLGSIRGLGPWSVGYLMMRCLGQTDVVPVGDAGLRRAMQELHGLPARPDRRQVLDLLEPFRPWRSLAVFHYWSRA